MRVTVIPTASGALRTVTKVLLQGVEDLVIRGRLETIQTTGLLRSARMLRRVQETRGDLQSLRLQWKIICWRWCKKHLKEKIIITINIIIFLLLFLSTLPYRVINKTPCKGNKRLLTLIEYMHSFNINSDVKGFLTGTYDLIFSLHW